MSRFGFAAHSIPGRSPLFEVDAAYPQAVENDARFGGLQFEGKFIQKNLATLSIWESPQAMMAFVRSGDHQKMLSDMKGRLGTSRFVEWKAQDKDFPLTWETAVEKLDPAAGGK